MNHVTEAEYKRRRELREKRRREVEAAAGWSQEEKGFGNFHGRARRGSNAAHVERRSTGK